MLETPTTINPVITIVVALLAGVGGATATYFFSRKKMQAEIDNLRAEARKNQAEGDKIIAELKGASAEVSWSLAASAEQILFDGTQHIDGFDVEGREGNFWKDNKAISPVGLGELQFEEGGVLNVQRRNKEGRFELWFRRYVYRGNEQQSIPTDDLISGKRKLRVSCEAKVSGIEHCLHLLLREASGAKLAEQRFTVKSTQWTKFQAFLSADPKDCVLRIDDEIDDLASSLPPGSVQIRSILLAQRN